MNSNWKGEYGYDKKNSMYSSDYYSQRKTVIDIGVGTRQQTQKRCGVVKQERVMAYDDSSQKQCTSGTCPWR